MKLGEWVESRMKATGQPKRAVLEDLASRSGIAFVTLESASRGARMGNYGKAKAVAQATDWAVTVLDLCDDNPAETLRLIQGVT